MSLYSTVASNTSVKKSVVPSKDREIRRRRTSTGTLKLGEADVFDDDCSFEFQEPHSVPFDSTSRVQATQVGTAKCTGAQVLADDRKIAKPIVVVSSGRTSYATQPKRRMLSRSGIVPY